MVTQVLFWLFAVLAASSALLMVTRRNPVSSALWLIGTFFSLAAIYTLLGAYFIGVIQILVYAGAIMVLFLFVIMLLNLGNDYEADIRGGVWKVDGGGDLSGDAGDPGADVHRRPAAAPLGDEAGPRALAAQVAENGTVGVIGIPLYNEYMVPLQATAILLLIAVVGRGRARQAQGVRVDRAQRNHPAELDPRAERDPLRRRGGGRGGPPQRHHPVHVRRADAQRGEPGLRRARPRTPASQGQVFVFFVIAVAAAEAAVGLAIIISVFRHSESVDMKNFGLLRW